MQLEEVQRPAHVQLVQREQVLESAPPVAHVEVMQSRQQRSRRPHPVAHHVVRCRWIVRRRRSSSLSASARANLLQEDLLQSALRERIVSDAQRFLIALHQAECSGQRRYVAGGNLKVDHRRVIIHYNGILEVLQHKLHTQTVHSHHHDASRPFSRA